MSDDVVTSCRDLDELNDEDCCDICHDDTETGHNRLELIRLDDGRQIRVCHSAEKALRERGLLTGGESAAWPMDPHE